MCEQSNSPSIDVKLLGGSSYKSGYKISSSTNEHLEEISNKVHNYPVILTKYCQLDMPSLQEMLEKTLNLYEHTAIVMRMRFIALQNFFFHLLYAPS